MLKCITKQKVIIKGVNQTLKEFNQNYEKNNPLKINNQKLIKKHIITFKKKMIIFMSRI